METQAKAPTTAQAEAIVANPTLCERVTAAAKHVKLITQSTLVMGGCLIAVSAYWLYAQRYSSAARTVIVAE